MPLATLSISSFFLTAKELPEEPCKRDNMIRPIVSKSKLKTYLGSVDNLVGEALRDRLEASEGGLTCTLADEVNGLVHSAEGRHVNGLSADNTTGSNTSGVLAGTTVGDSGDTDLDGVLAGEEVNQFHGLLDNFDSLLLFTVVPVAGGHHHADEALDDRALRLLESTLLVAAGSVGHEDSLARRLHLKVVREGVVRALDALVAPLAEQFGLHGEFGLVVLLKDSTVVTYAITTRA